MKRILVVDDHVLIRSLVRKELESMGYEIDVSTDGVLALSRLKMKHYDLVITDLNMPNLCGLDLVKAIRNSDSEYKDIPILCMTGEDPTKLKPQAAELGATGWIQKPFNPDTWAPTLARLTAS